MLRRERSSPLSILIFLLLFFSASLGAQEPGEKKEHRLPEKPQPAFVIADVEYQINGLILRPFLEEFLAIEKGRTFHSLDSLRDYIDSLTQLLISNRVFQEKSTITMDILEGERPRKVIIKVITYTSLTSLMVPLAKYNSTDGFSLVFRYKDFNFLGTLEPLSLTLDYYVESNQVEMATYFNLPYYILGGRWSLDVAEEFLYTKSGGISPNGSLSLSASYPFSALGLQWYAAPLISHLYERDYLRHTVRGGISAGFTFKAGLDWSVVTYADFYDEYVSSHYPYIENGIVISSSIPIVDLPWFGRVRFSPSLGLFDIYGLKPRAFTDLGWSFSGNLGFGRIDGIRNFRKGASFSIGASYADHFLETAPIDKYDFGVNLNATLFTVFNPVIGFDLRLLGNWFVSGTYIDEITSYDWEEYIRGEKEVRYGDLGIIANIQLPINFAQGYFFGSERFDAEVFLIPFVDMGYVRSSPTAPFLDKKDMVLSAGLEIAVFPEYARAFIYRLSAGYNIMKILNGEDPSLEGIEIWLGLGLHF